VRSGNIAQKNRDIIVIAQKASHASLRTICAARRTRRATRAPRVDRIRAVWDEQG